MNKPLIFLCLAIVGFFCWKEQATLLKWKDQLVSQGKKLSSPPGEEVAQQDKGAASNPPASPPTVAGNADAPPMQIPRQPAVTLPPPPEGVYYLTERTKITTATGISAYQAGLEVKKVSEEGNMMVVTDGTNSFPVATSNLTRDIAKVMEIRRKESEAKAEALAAAATKAAAGSGNNKSASLGAVANPAAQTAAAKAQARARNETMRKQITVQIDNIDARMRQLQKQISDAQAQAEHARLRGRGSSADASVPGWRQEVDKLQTARMAYLAQLSAIR